MTMKKPGNDLSSSGCFSVGFGLMAFIFSWHMEVQAAFRLAYRAHGMLFWGMNTDVPEAKERARACRAVLCESS